MYRKVNKLKNFYPKIKYDDGDKYIDIINKNKNKLRVTVSEYINYMTLSYESMQIFGIPK